MIEGSINIATLPARPTSPAAENGRDNAAASRGFVVEPTMTAEAVLQGVGRECLAELRRHEAAALAGQLEAFHLMRVALRRLRSVLSALKSMLPPAQYQWARIELKWLADSLGPARDWDAFVSDLLAPVQKALPESGEFDDLVDAAKRRRNTAYDAAKDALRSHRHAEAMEKLAGWFEARRWRDQPASETSAPLFASIADVAPRLIERRWRQVRKRGKHFAKLSQAERHQLRIALKKFRYMIEFLGALFDAGEVKVLVKRLKPLQQELGHLNDVCTAHRLIEEIVRPGAGNTVSVSKHAGLVLGWYIRGTADEEGRLRKHVRRLRKVKPFWPPSRQRLLVEIRSEAPSPSGV